MLNLWVNLLRINEYLHLTIVAFHRFVRFVSTPEILERVYIIESEIIQIEEAIAIQGKNDTNGLVSISSRVVFSHPSCNL